MQQELEPTAADDRDRVDGFDDDVLRAQCPEELRNVQETDVLAVNIWFNVYAVSFVI